MEKNAKMKKNEEKWKKVKLKKWKKWKNEEKWKNEKKKRAPHSYPQLRGLRYAGGIWKGDIMVADIEELEEMDASELLARRLNAKEVLTPQRSGNFLFPVADGTGKIFGRERLLRTSTLTRDRPERWEKQENLQGKSDELLSPTPLQEDSTRDDEDAKSDFWTITGELIHLSSPRWTQSQTVRAARRSISYSVEVHRRYQNDSYHLECIDGETYWRLLERGWRKKLSDAWTGFTKFILLNEWPLDGYTWTGRRLTRRQKLVILTTYGQICGRVCPMQPKRKQNKDGLSRNQNSIMPENWEKYISNQTMKSSRESWKFRCQEQCLSKYR